MVPLVIKLGGVLLDSEEALERLFSTLQLYRKNHKRPLLLVHGGGCLVDDLMQRLQLPISKKQGLRVTPEDQIDIIAGTLAGTANKTLLACSTKFRLPGIGLCLGDGGIAKVTQLGKEFGHTGKAEPGKPDLLKLLLDVGYIPIVSSIGITEQGELMNVNADQAATAIAQVLNADLVFLSDVSGILDGKGQKIPEATTEKIEQLIAQGIITDGMIVKVYAALDAAKSLGQPVDIASWRYADQLIALFNGIPVGTRISA
ncbi:acetylglutamate kinase [Xenorhabdus mauleonii]|uniref:Acetylglutamate kinase n=1 Tax=Xenorhabdus mauleonii TaxID=351675 RepID=A0A1I3U3J6_9GAMM|nr:acetylglutamate kinase [Xenorhabdus mauleonii]PHM39522.1 acetylglutamate kinase [Xenorhabdus mauleonii]SFJ76367.1 N-acetylglutamate kinase [Xenorhabdus mauleonii]